jgi:hypothetical protein
VAIGGMLLRGGVGRWWNFTDMGVWGISGNFTDRVVWDVGGMLLTWESRSIRRKILS